MMNSPSYRDMQPYGLALDCLQQDVTTALAIDAGIVAMMDKTERMIS